jgi:hypothetical protein
MSADDRRRRDRRRRLAKGTAKATTTEKRGRLRRMPVMPPDKDEMLVRHQANLDAVAELRRRLADNDQERRIR